MTTTTHTRSVHIDAPVEKVFEHVSDPESFFAAIHEADPSMPDRITKKSTERGVGSTVEWTGRLFLVPVHTVVTRTEYVPNERVVDHQPKGGVTWTHMTEPDETGTKLTLQCDVSTKVPFFDKLEDTLLWKGDEDLDKYLAAYKKAIEA